MPWYKHRLELVMGHNLKMLFLSVVFKVTNSVKANKFSSHLIPRLKNDTDFHLHKYKLKQNIDIGLAAFH
jgi:hypothetical protein